MSHEGASLLRFHGLPPKIARMAEVFCLTAPPTPRARGNVGFSCMRAQIIMMINWFPTSDCDKVFRECAARFTSALEGRRRGMLLWALEDCYDKSPDVVFRYCEGCDGLWCFDCWDGNLICDDGDCDAVMCRACADAAEHEFFCCHDGCEKTWCSECKPDAEFACCMFCAGMWCEECDPGLRSVEDTFVDGAPPRTSATDVAPPAR